MANLKDVARLAEVDPSTVSRVLRGDPSQTVRPETRERILAAAMALRYRPNALARGLRTRRTDTIGLVMPDVGNLGFAEVTHGIQAAAAEAGRLVLLIEANTVTSGGDSTPHTEQEYAQLIGDGRVDGLIVAFATLDDRLVAHLAERHIPLVLVNRRTAGVHGAVVVDDERGSRLAVEHLIGLGHRRIGFVGLAAETDTARRRQQGYRAAMTEAGIPIDPSWMVSGEPTMAGGHAAVGPILGRPPSVRPTAIFVASLLGTVGVLGRIRTAGLRVPDDVSVIAFNDHELADHLDPPLTTVWMPNLQMGRQAVHMLLAALEGEPVHDLMITEPPRIVQRGSTAPPGSGL